MDGGLAGTREYKQSELGMSRRIKPKEKYVRIAIWTVRQKVKKVRRNVLEFGRPEVALSD